MASTLTLSESNLRHNVSVAREILGDVALLGVVKANGYGHGAVAVARLLVGAGVGWLGVTDAEEGAVVRGAVGETARILVMTAPPGGGAEAREAAEMALRHGLTPVVYTVGQIGVLEEVAARAGRTVAVHVEIDTGMSRQGVRPGAELEGVYRALAGSRWVRLDGICTHLASAECVDGVQTGAQMEAFRAGLFCLGEVSPEWLHVGNSSAIDNAGVGVLGELGQLARERMATAMSRCGLGLYGYTLPLDPDRPGGARMHGRLRPVMEWTTTVASVEEVPAGARVGYSGTYTAREPMRLGLLPVGYADGLRRSLSSTNEAAGGWVMVGGRRAAIVGRVSMNVTTVDLTGVDAGPGSRVVLLGEGVTAEDHARVAGCLAYEVLCGVRATRHAVA